MREMNKPDESGTDDQVQILLPEHQGQTPHSLDIILQTEFGMCVRISLEKLAKYPLTQRLAVYVEYDELYDPSNHLFIGTAQELIARIITMRDGARTAISQGTLKGNELDARMLMIAFDDLDENTTFHDVQQRWADMYERPKPVEGDDIEKLTNALTQMMSPEGRRVGIEQKKFEALNLLRGLDDDRIIAIRIFNDKYELLALQISELKDLINSMENPENSLSFGLPFSFRIEAYDDAKEYAEQKKTESAIADMRHKKRLLDGIAQYADTELITWVYPNEPVDHMGGRCMFNQHTVADLRRRIDEADHDELDWFSHAGGMHILAVGEVDLDELEQKMRKGFQAFQEQIREVIDGVNARMGMLDDGKVIDVGEK